MLVLTLELTEYEASGLLSLLGDAEDLPSVLSGLRARLLSLSKCSTRMAVPMPQCDATDGQTARMDVDVQAQHENENMEGETQIRFMRFPKYHPLL